MAVKRSCYNVALDSQGFVIKGLPNTPARLQRQMAIYGNRYASGDRSYADFSHYWFWSQTDWSGGFQQEKWKDEAKFKSSSNVDVLTKYGEVKPLYDLSLVYTSINIQEFKSFALFNNLIYIFQAKADGSSTGKVILNSADTADASAVGGAYTFYSSEVYKDKIYLGCKTPNNTQLNGALTAANTTVTVDSTTGFSASGTIYIENEIITYTGVTATTFTGCTRGTSGSKAVEHSDNVVVVDQGSLKSMNIENSTVPVRFGSAETHLAITTGERLYIAEKSRQGSLYGDSIWYSDDGTTFTSLIAKTGQNKQVIKGCENLGLFYYLVKDNNSIDLWRIDDLWVTHIYTWDYLLTPDIYSFLGEVYIAGYDELGKELIFKWDGASLDKVFEEKISLSPKTEFLTEFKGKLYNHKLVSDGQVWTDNYNLSYSTYPAQPFLSAFGKLYFVVKDTATPKYYIYKLNTSAYQTTTNIITGTYTGDIPAIDKYWNSVELNFEKFSASGQSIQVQYSTDDETTWTSLTPTISQATHGAIDTYVLKFADNTISKKIQLKIILTSTSAVPTILKDFTVSFLPLPHEKYEWQLTLNCSDNILLADFQSYEPKTGLELRNLLKNKWLTHNKILLEDVDYAETTLNGALTAVATTITVVNTDGFSEQGRIKIDSEEIFYTGKTKTTLTGCVRGSRGTKAVSHTSTTTISNGYNVMITNYQEELPILNKEQTEYFCGISLKEL